MDEESKAAIGDRIKPLPSTEGMDDEQLRQLARELHSAIDKVCFQNLRGEGGVVLKLFKSLCSSLTHLKLKFKK